MSQTYDRAGSVTSDGRSLTGITGDAGTNTQSFSYDALHRLTGSSGLAAGATSYQYDLDGNRTRRVEAGVTTDYAYDRADQLQQQTIGATTRTFAYDRYGNLTQSADAASAYTTYAYDEASRLTGITPPAGGAVSFTLDALDRPKDRQVAGTGTTDTYSYLDATETTWLTGQATTTGALLDAEGTRLALKTGSSVSWLVFDLHGSVAGLCPAGTTALADAYRYDGWGRQVAKSGSSTNPYRYRGLLNLGTDELSGALLAMGAREYSSQLGTFTQEDSVAGSAANPATMNRFLYALANPATLVDPDGHMACLDTGDACTTSGELAEYVGTRHVTQPKSSHTTDCNTTCAGPGVDVRVVDGFFLTPDHRLLDPGQYEDLSYCAVIWPPPTVGACAWYWNTRNARESQGLGIYVSEADDEHDFWLGDLTIALIYAGINEYGRDVITHGEWNIRLGLTAESRMLYLNQKVLGAGLRYELGVSQVVLGRQILRGAFILSVGTDLIASGVDQWKKDDGYDPFSRLVRASARGGATALGGLAGGALALFLANLVCGGVTGGLGGLACAAATVTAVGVGSYKGAEWGSRTSEYAIDVYWPGGPSSHD